MAANSEIEWTTATFNPWIGCTKVSPGCAHCYAETMAKFRGWARWGKGKPRMRTSRNLWNGPIKWNEQARAECKRTRVFCASLADVFEGPEVLREDFEEHVGAELADARPADAWELLGDAVSEGIFEGFSEQRGEFLVEEIGLGAHGRISFRGASFFFGPQSPSRRSWSR